MILVESGSSPQPQARFRQSWVEARTEVSRLADYFDSYDYPPHEERLHFRPVLLAIDRIVEAELDWQFAARVFVHWLTFSRHGLFWSSAPCLCLWPGTVDAFIIHDCIESQPGPQHLTEIATFNPATNAHIQTLLELPIQWDRPKRKRRGRLGER